MSGHIQPAGPPPAGMSSNFVDPHNLAPNLIACNIVLLVFSVLIVIARILSRTVLTDWRLGWDDYTVIAAMVGTAIFTSFVITTTNYGLGRHIWDVPMSVYSPGYLWWIMATFAACPASYYFVKLSILFFYLRVFELQAKLRYMIYFLFAYCTIYYGIAFFAIIGLCNVNNRQWDINVTMNCFAYGKLTFAIGGLDLVADVLVLAFPIPQVLKLHISWPQKIYLLFVFLFGITASVACAIRVALAVKSRHTTDATWAQYHVVVLFCIEHYLALIAACMPTLGPFFRFLNPNRLKRVAKGHKTLGDDAGGPWSQKGTLDHSLMYGSVFVSKSRDNDAAFDKSMSSQMSHARRSQSANDMPESSVSRNDDLENGIEMHRPISR